jgi:hypothetical protein
VPDEQEKVSNTDALKALVQHALSGAIHPDQEGPLRDWWEQNASEQEKDDRLSDDEFIEKHGKTRAQAAADRSDTTSARAPAASSIPATGGTDTDEEPADEGAKPKSGTRK